MCPSCEMVQGTVSFPTKVCEVYHVSLENESGTGIYKPLNSQDWHAHVNLKQHMTWIQCKFLTFLHNLKMEIGRKYTMTSSQLLMPVTITAALAVKGNDFISRAIPIDRYTLYSNFKNSFLQSTCFYISNNTWCRCYLWIINGHTQ